MTCYARHCVPHMQHHEQLTGVDAICTELLSLVGHCLLQWLLECVLVETRAKVREGIRRLCKNGSCKRWQWIAGQTLFCDEKAFRCVLNGLSRIYSSIPETNVCHQF